MSYLVTYAGGRRNFPKEAEAIAHAKTLVEAHGIEVTVWQKIGSAKREIPPAVHTPVEKV